MNGRFSLKSGDSNMKAEESSVRKQLILDIMTAMMKEDGLRYIADGQNMIAYNKDVTLCFYI